MAKVETERLVGDEIQLMMEREAGADERMVSAILVGFGTMHEYDEAKSLEAGHPTYVDRVYFSYKVPGDKSTHLVRPAEETDFERFPRAYAAFTNRSTTPIAGMPLEQWPQISRGEILALKRMDIHTVESLAEVHDGHIDKLGQNARGLRTKAKVYLEMAKDTAVAQRLAAENERKDMQLADMQRQLADLQARFGGDKKRKEAAA